MLRLLFAIIPTLPFCGCICLVPLAGLMSVGDTETILQRARTLRSSNGHRFLVIGTIQLVRRRSYETQRTNRQYRQ